MKTTMFMALAGACLSFNCAAAVVSGSNVTLEPYAFDDADYAITTFQDMAGDYTSMWFNKVDDARRGTTTLTTVTWNVDEGADYYLAPAGAALSKDTLQAGLFTPLLSVDTPASITVPLSGTFYLGISTGLGFTGSEPNRDVFGWVELQSTPGGLSIVDSAMAYGERGIYIGTTLPVPEPQGAMLALAGLGLLALSGAQKPR